MLEKLDQPGTARQQALGGGVEIRAKLRERRHFTVLGQVEAQRACHLLHRSDLRRAPHPRYRDADVHCRPHARIKQIGFQEDLAIGDRDHVGRDVGRDITSLGLDHRQRRERAAALSITHFRCPLQETGMEVEDISRIRLTSGRPAQQE